VCDTHGDRTFQHSKTIFDIVWEDGGGGGVKSMRISRTGYRQGSN